MRCVGFLGCYDSARNRGKRRFWKSERTVGNVFSKSFSRVWVLDLGGTRLKIIRKMFPSVRSVLRNLRLGSIKLARWFQKIDAGFWKDDQNVKCGFEALRVCVFVKGLRYGQCRQLITWSSCRCLLWWRVWSPSSHSGRSSRALHYRGRIHKVQSEANRCQLASHVGKQHFPRLTHAGFGKPINDDNMLHGMHETSLRPCQNRHG